LSRIKVYLYNKKVIKSKPRKSRFIPVPSWALSLLAAILVAIILGVLNSINLSISDTIKYVIWELLIATACFFICWNDPGSVWYVPLLCNIINLLPAIFDDTFWTTSFGLIVFLGLGLSVITAILGAKTGQRADDRNTPQHDRVSDEVKLNS
jgi:hypothetical protein